MRLIYISLILLFIQGNLFGKTTLAYKKMDGSAVNKCFGASLPSALKFRNTSKQKIYDFALYVSYQDGSPVDFAITSVTVDKKIRTGFSRKGFVPMAGANNVVRIGAKDANGDYDPNEALGTNDLFKLDINLNKTPSKPWCINVQPTDKGSRAIAASDVAAFFGNQRTYFLAMDQPMATSNLFPGVSFADVNVSGYPIDTFFLTSQTTQINNPVFLSPFGDTIPPLFYDPFTGLLVSPIPVLPEETFSIGFRVNSFPFQNPMEIHLDAVLPGPLTEPHAGLLPPQLIVHQGTPTATGILPIEYQIPRHHPQPFLQIVAQHPIPAQPHVWVGQNIMLEHFPDTMEIDLMAQIGDLLPTGTTNLQLAWTISDTIMEVAPVFPPFQFAPYPVFAEVSDYGPVPMGPHAIPQGALPPLPPRYWKTDDSEGVLIGCRMPNMDVDSSRYRGDGKPKPYVPNNYAGDWNACGPIATTNSFTWLRGLYPDVDQKLGAAFGEGDTAMRKMLAEFSELMKRQSEGTVYITNFIKAKLAFVDKYKLPIKVSFQSMHRNDKSIASPDKRYGHKAEQNEPAPKAGQTMAGITPEFLLDALKDSCDTEILFNWRKVDGAGNVTYPNGHYVTLTGIRNSDGNWRIKWKDDKKQGEVGGTRQGVSGLVVDSTTGMVRIPGLDNDTWGKCFISNVAIECYDPSVTFKGVKGNAFRDPSGSGTSTGKTGMGGLAVNLIDATSGFVLQTAITAPDGSYHLDQIGNPNTPKYIEFMVPPGVLISPQNQGTNDSIDSDINPLNGQSQPLIFVIDTFYTINAGFGVPGLDIKVFTEGMFDPQGDTLVPFLQLPLVCEACNDLNLPIMPQWPDSIALPSSEFSDVTGDFVIQPDTHYTFEPVEWAYVALWDSINATQPILGFSALLLHDGTLVMPTFDPLDLFQLPLPAGLNQAYVSVWVPGHLGIITGNPMPLNQPLAPIDFTDPSFLVPPGMSGHDLMSQSMVLRMGDTNADGVIDAADRAGTWNSRNTSGYKLDDINRDGVVDAADRAGTWNNRNKQGHAIK